MRVRVRVELPVPHSGPDQEDAGSFGGLVGGRQQGRAGKAAFRLGVGLGLGVTQGEGSRYKSRVGLLSPCHRQS